jgi:hypothetical protein
MRRKYPRKRTQEFCKENTGWEQGLHPKGRVTVVGDEKYAAATLLR